MKILSFWVERGVFDAAETGAIDSAMMTLVDPAGALEQVRLWGGGGVGEVCGAASAKVKMGGR